MSSSPKFGHAAVAAARVLADRPSRHHLTDQQRSALAAWPGWGPLSPVFEHAQTATWAAIGEQLEELLGVQAMSKGSQQVDNAFYTSEDVANRIWRLLACAGFGGGRVLDLGCGHGRFALACPGGLDIDYQGVEIDPTAARIAQLANPQAQIINSACRTCPCRRAGSIWWWAMCRSVRAGSTPGTGTPPACTPTFWNGQWRRCVPAG